MKRMTWLGVLIGVLAIGCNPAPAPSEGSTLEREIAAGQVWRYASRDGEEESRLIVCRVEEDPKLGAIVHVRIEGVRIRSPQAPSGYTTEIGHMPFERGALLHQLRGLEPGRRPDVDCSEGYQQWRDAFDQGEAGVFTISVAEAVRFMEQALGG